MVKDTGNTNEKTRLSYICNLLRNQDTADANQNVLPSDGKGLRQSMSEIYGDINSVEMIGGLQSPFDIRLNNTIQTEVKVSQTKKTSRSVLEKEPWVDGVQVLQSQVVSQLSKPIFGTGMIKDWFTNYVLPFIEKTASCSHLKPTYEEYQKVIFTISKSTTDDTDAHKFIQLLRTNKTLQKSLQKEYLKFEYDWLTKHGIHLKKLETVLKEKFSQKHVWICINKVGCHVIRQILLEELSSYEVVKRASGGAVLHIQAIFRKVHTNERYPLTLEMRFNWKNGGQAVQNLNFDIRSPSKKSSSASSSTSAVQESPKIHKLKRALKKSPTLVAAESPLPPLEQEALHSPPEQPSPSSSP